MNCSLVDGCSWFRARCVDAANFCACHAYTLHGARHEPERLADSYGTPSPVTSIFPGIVVGDRANPGMEFPLSVMAKHGRQTQSKPVQNLRST